MKTKQIVGILLVLVPILISACKENVLTVSSGDRRSTDVIIYPAYADANNNGINDYVEQETHLSGPDSSVSSTTYRQTDAAYAAQSGHVFVDENGNGICDFAEDGSNTWHGPGYIDENGNGICDYWDEDSTQHNHHQGMMYLDQNNNGINDSFEEVTHVGGGHDFVDADGDGICDLAQDGSNTWHGPGYMDEDHDGIHDEWQAGGRGRGHGRGHGHMGG